jgi:hypothetical protein
MASAILAENLRIVRRQCLTASFDLPPPTRPSILDPMRGDCWIGLGKANSLTLFVGKQPLVYLAGTRLDWMALNSRLLELRQGRPRNKCRG